MLKEYLSEHGFSYEEKMVDVDDAARKEMMVDSDGFLGVPFTKITKEDNSKEFVVGFDKGKLNLILQINQ